MPEHRPAEGLGGERALEERRMEQSSGLGLDIGGFGGTDSCRFQHMMSSDSFDFSVLSISLCQFDRPVVTCPFGPGGILGILLPVDS